jgi:hypothetical protein
MIEMSADIGKLAAALCKAQKDMEGAKKDAKNPAFKSKYATLENVIDVAKPALTSEGIAFTQAPGAVIDGVLEMTTMLIHGESGQWMRSTLHVPLGKRDAQGVGSAITYARRYALMSVLGIPAEDDDGNAASEKPDFRVESRDLAKMVNDQPTIADLTDLYKTPRVQAFLHNAPAELAEALKSIFAERKHTLTPKKEAA